MSGLAQIARAHIAKLPEVLAVVVTDRAGALIEVSGDVDGEALGAVYAVAAESLARAGHTLGLGPLARVVITGRTSACLVAVDGEGIIAAQVDGSKPMQGMNGLERKLESLLRR